MLFQCRPMFRNEKGNKKKIYEKQKHEQIYNVLNKFDTYTIVKRKRDELHGSSESYGMQRDCHPWNTVNVRKTSTKK